MLKQWLSCKTFMEVGVSIIASLSRVECSHFRIEYKNIEEVLVTHL